MTRALALAAIALLALPLVASQAAPEPWNYGLRFDCPPPPAAPVPGRECPTRIEASGESLGAPSVALDPTSAARMAVASLAGTLAEDGRSREGGATHALFVSQDGGQSFARVPLPAPAAGALGLEVAAVADPAGGLHVAALHVSGQGTMVSAWKLASFTDAPGEPATFAPLAGRQSSLSIAVVENGTVALAWHEDAGTPRVAWSPTAPSAPWNVTSSPGPSCAALSNAVAMRGALWMACEAGAGVVRPDVAPGDLALVAFHLANASFEARARAPFSGAPRLADAGDGRLALAAVDVESPEVVHLRVSVWSARTNWSIPLDPGMKLHGPDRPPVAEARLLAFGHRDGSDTLHAVYEERPAAPPEATAPRAVKQLVAFELRGTLAYASDLGVDELRPAGPPPAALPDLGSLAPPSLEPSARAPLPDDVRDGLAFLGTREAFAYGDAGVLVVGELVETWMVPPASPAPPEDVLPSQGVTSVTTLPPPKFTLAFEIAAGLLAFGVVARVLVGRFVVRSAAPDPGDPKP